MAPPAPAAVAGPRTPPPEVQKVLDKVSSEVVTKGKAPAALRLVFHDAGPYSKAAGNGGLNASVEFELDRPENFGLKRGWRLVTEMESRLVGTPAEGLVSRADLVTVAGARAVAVCGGPSIPIQIGRVDATGPDPEGRMPAETLSAADLKSNFADHGFNVREFIALCGAHTIGSKGFGAPDKFDNEYYTRLLARPWLNPEDKMASMIGLPSDHVLPDDEECVPYIKEFAADQDAFFNAFVAAYVKLAAAGATWRAA